MPTPASTAVFNISDNKPYSSAVFPFFILLIVSQLCPCLLTEVTCLQNLSETKYSFPMQALSSEAPDDNFSSLVSYTLH